MPVKKAVRPHQNPPENSTKRRFIKVGVLNTHFQTYSGPQRNRPADSSRYRVSLNNRTQAYGEFSWALLRDRVVSERGDGVLYTLDGNGSNYWLEGRFGPDFEVPCIVVEGLSLTEENYLFQRLQVVKKVTPTEKYRVDLEFDQNSLAVKIEKALPPNFHITQSTQDSFGLGRTTAEWVMKTYGKAALTRTLNEISELFDESETARTNGALIKAVAKILNNADERKSYDDERLWRLLAEAKASDLAEQARGAGAETIVLNNIRRLYENAYPSEQAADSATAPLAEFSAV